MSDLQDNLCDDKNDDTLTHEEQSKIDSIQKVSFVQEYEEFKTEELKPEKPFSFWSIFNFDASLVAGALGGIGSRQRAPFNIPRRIGLDKVVTINNISGKNAYVILAPVPIKELKNLGLGAKAAGFGGSTNMEFENNGEYKVQKISIANNTRSEYDLDNSQFYCTLFLDIDGEWKKIWDNRRINGKKFDINILERHVKAALEKDHIPDF